MKYLFVAVMFLACSKDLKIQGETKRNIFLGDIPDWTVHESGAFNFLLPTYKANIILAPPYLYRKLDIPDADVYFIDTGYWRADNDYPKWIFGSDKVTRLDIFQPGWFLPVANDTVPICKHIYVAVEPDTVYDSHDAMGQVGLAFGFGPRPTGKNLICVKCHHITEQLITTKFPTGRSKVVPVDSIKLWLGYSPIKEDKGYKLFWHPGRARLTSVEEVFIFGSGSVGVAKNTLPGGLTEIIAGDCTGDCKKKK